jgi:hypothetical protein
VTYLITYLSSSNEPHTIEWIAPEAWSPAAIAQAFQQQFPAAQLLSLEPAA